MMDYWVDIEKVGNRIHLKSRYRPDMPARCKSVSGARWAKDKKVWTYPLEWSVCLDLRQVFGKELRIGRELAEWAKKEKARMDGLRDVARMDAIDIERVEREAPRLADAMGKRTYQQVGTAWLARAGRALLGDQPGLGKTLQTIGAVIERGLYGPVVVFAPKTAAMVTWPNELRKWVPDEPFTVVSHLPGPKRRVALQDFRDQIDFDARVIRAVNEGTLGPEDAMGVPPRRWLIANIEMVRSQKASGGSCKEPGPFAWESDGMKGVWHHAYAELFKIPWAAIVVDESHRALITRTALRDKQTLQRAGFGLLPLAENGMRIALSGTPMRGKPENLWGTLNWLRPEVYTGFWRWAEKWFDIYDDGFGQVIGGLKEDREKQFYAEMDGIMLRRTKAEVLPDLPPKLYAGDPPPDNPDGPVGIWLPMEPEQAKAYQEMEAHAASQLEGGTLIATGVLAEMTRLKQFATSYGDINDNFEFMPKLPSNKFNWLENFFEEREIIPEKGQSRGPSARKRQLTGGELEKQDADTSKIIVASQFTRVINMFAEEFRKMGVECHVLTGETKNADRVRIQKEFQEEGGPRVVFLNTMAGGVSLTLDSADDVVFLDETYIPDDQEQVEDRAHRASRMHQVTITYLRSLDTIEQTIAEVTDGRENAQKTLLDGRRGVDFAKRLLRRA